MIWLWADEGLRRPINGRSVLDPMRDKSKYTREGGELVRHSDAGPNEIYDAHGNYGTDGIVDPNRKPQRDYWETKAVYAPVRVLADRVPFTPGQANVFVEVRNDFDFLNLSTVGISWKLFRNANVLASGETKLDAPPHVTTILTIPTTAVTRENAPRGAHYLQLTFQRTDGSVITQHSVRLDYEPAPQPRESAAPTQPPKVETQGDAVIVTAGPARYEFNSRSGEISAISIAGKTIISAAKPVVWRPATFSECNSLDKRPVQHDWDTFMQNPAVSLKAWHLAGPGEGVVISAQTEYREDEHNFVTVDYTYLVSADGTLHVTLRIEPKLDAPWLPEIGIEFTTGASAKNLTWLGQGPLDSLPNKTAATIFGQWSADANSDIARGTKSGIEWAKLLFDNGVALQIKEVAGVRMIPIGEDRHRFRALTNLAGAWTKNGPPERPEWRLDLSEGRTFSGSFEIIPIAPASSSDQ
jgi:beta-galactosidase